MRMMEISGYRRDQDRTALQTVKEELARVGLIYSRVSGDPTGCYTFMIDQPADEARSQEARGKRRFPPITVMEPSGSFAAMAGQSHEVEVAPWMLGDVRPGLLNDAVDGLGGKGYVREASTRTPPHNYRMYIETHRVGLGDVHVRLALVQRSRAPAHL